MMASIFVAPLQAQQSDLEKGFAGALRGCELWVLEPGTHIDGPSPFLDQVGLGNMAGFVSSVDDSALPPPQYRAGSRYLRINSTLSAGYILVISEQLPICHITGGGGSDLQPVVETVLASKDFLGRWEKVKDSNRGDMASTTYRSREDPKFTMMISRARKAGERLDRVQVLATATLELKSD